AAPVHHRGIWLVFKLASEIVMAQIVSELIEPALRGERRFLKFAVPVFKQPLGSVQSPYLDWLVEHGRIAAQQGSDFTCGTSGDHHQSRLALVKDLGDCFAHSSVGTG